MVSREGSYYTRTDVAQVQAKRAWSTDSDTKLRSVISPSQCNIRRPNVVGGIGGMIGNAFGPLLASAILDRMDGVMDQAAWRYTAFLSCRPGAYLSFPDGSFTSKVL